MCVLCVHAYDTCMCLCVICVLALYKAVNHFNFVHEKGGCGQSFKYACVSELYSISFSCY